MPTRLPVQPRESHHQVFGKVLVDFHKVAVVHNPRHDFFDVVRLVGLNGHQRVEPFVSPVGGIPARDAGRVLLVVLRHEAEQFADQRQAVGVVAGDEVRHAAGGVVRHGAAQIFLAHILVHDGFDDVRPGHKHVTGILDHHREVGNGRRIDRSARARPHDGGNLGDDAGSHRVAQEDIGISRQRRHAFLDARASRSRSSRSLARPLSWPGPSPCRFWRHWPHPVTLRTR